MPYKTRLMLEAEVRLGQPLEKALPELFNTWGMQKLANFLGVEDATVVYWMRKLEITTCRVAVPPGYRVVLVPANGVGGFIDLSRLQG